MENQLKRAQASNREEDDSELQPLDEAAEGSDPEEDSKLQAGLPPEGRRTASGDEDSESGDEGTASF